MHSDCLTGEFSSSVAKKSSGVISSGAACGTEWVQFSAGWLKKPGSRVQREVGVWAFGRGAPRKVDFLNFSRAGGQDGLLFLLSSPLLCSVLSSLPESVLARELQRNERAPGHRVGRQNDKGSAIAGPFRDLFQPRRRPHVLRHSDLRPGAAPRCRPREERRIETTRPERDRKSATIMAGGTEPFPPLTAAADRQLHSEAAGLVRRRRKSSILGTELRVGDTGAPSLATGIAHLHGTAKVRCVVSAGRRRKKLADFS